MMQIPWLAAIALVFGAPNAQAVPGAAAPPAAAVTQPEAEDTEAAAKATDSVGVPQRWPVRQACTTTDDSPSCATLRAEAIGGYRYARVGGDTATEFDLDRADAGLGLVWRHSALIDGGVNWGVEAIRSAGPQSLIGVDGDSMVVRMLEAYGHGALHAGPVDVGVRVGLLPERWVEQVSKGYDLRGIDALTSDRLLFDRSDLGATLTASALNGMVELDLQYVNGEGQAQREQNTGKNSTVMLTVRPLMLESASGPTTLALHAAYRDGSLGVASVQNHRAAGAVTFASRYGYAGAEYVRATGVEGQPERRSTVLGFWASGHLLAPYLGLLFKFDRVDQDTSVEDATVTRLTAGVFSDLFPYVERNLRRLRLHAAYRRESYGDAAGPLPGAPEASLTHSLLITLQASGLHRF
ncbi:MAG: hypothetical protein KF718_32850 [Polyangiaceae bacterium]|nr:hypothetical protein [Polyangiaceae bacterium]